MFHKSDRQPLVITIWSRGIQHYPFWVGAFAGVSLFTSLIGAASHAAAPIDFVAGGTVGGVYSVDPANSADGGALLAPDNSGVLQWPSGLSIDSSGTLLVSSDGGGVIARFDKQGNGLGLFSDDPAMSHPGISVLGPLGNMFVIQGAAYNKSVVELSASGVEIRKLSLPNVGGGAFAQAINALAFGPDNNLYIGVGGITGNVLKINGQTGQYISTIVSGTAEQFVTGLSFGPYGYLYVESTNSGGSAHALQRYSAGAGKELGTISSAPLDTMAFGPDGRLYGLGNDQLFQLRVNATGAATLEASRSLSALSQASATQMRFAPNTFAGQQTAIDITSTSPGSTHHATIQFNEVLAAGTTSLLPVDVGTLPSVSGITFWSAVDLSTNALIDGSLRIDFHFDPASLPEGRNQSDLRLFTYDSVTGLQSVPSYVNVDSLAVEATVDSLGTYAIGFVPEPTSCLLFGIGGILALPALRLTKGWLDAK